VDACEKRSLALEKRINAQKSKMLDGKHLQRLNASRHEAEVEQTNAYIAQLKQELATAEREKKDMAEKLEQAAVREAELKRKLKEQGVERQKASFSSLKWI
jgi:CRISPR/Cas system-associated endoribonuclease Cas2